MAAGSYERQLVNALTECGRLGLRAPSSGAATDRDLPDVLAGRAVTLGGASIPSDTLADVWAIELKTGKSTTLYVKEEEVEALTDFSMQFGATPLIGAKFKSPGGGRTAIYLVRPEDCRMTDAGNHGVPESDVEERAYAVVLPATRTQPPEVRVIEGG